MGGEGRVLVAGMRFEANSFVPGSTTLADFERGHVLRGLAVLAIPGNEIAGFRNGADDLGLACEPLLDLFAASGPPMASSEFERIQCEFSDSFRQAGEASGVYLALHGAAMTWDADDPEGELIAGVRQIVGKETPIVASFDLHCQFSERRARLLDGVVGYRTCPHTDLFETGARAAALLAELIDSNRKTTVSRQHLPMVTPAQTHDTTDGPLRAVMTRAAELESDPTLASVSVFASQPWLDVPGLGWEVVVVSYDDSDPTGAVGRRVARELGSTIWAARTSFAFRGTPIPEAVDRVQRSTGQPWILADGADSPSAGSGGDGNELLAYLLDHGNPIGPVHLSVTDATAAHSCYDAGAGTNVEVMVGGSLAPTFYAPVRIVGHVTATHSGPYATEYPPGSVDVGKIAVVDTGEIRIVITEKPAMMLDRALYETVGLDTRHAKAVQVKSAGGFRAFYEQLAAGVIDLDTTGPSSSDLVSLPYRRRPTELWPFEDVTWSPHDEL